MAKPGANRIAQALVEADPQQRERLAVRMVIEHEMFAGPMLLPFGIHPLLSVYVLEVPCAELVPGVAGDVDILVLPLRLEDAEFRRWSVHYGREMPRAHQTQIERFAAMHAAALGGLSWPPATDRVVGIEAKCMYVAPSGKLKSKKASPQKLARLQIEVARMFRMGVDGASLLDVVAAQPAGGPSPWIEAHGSAIAAKATTRAIVQARLDDEHRPGDVALRAAGHFALHVVPIAGSSERERGAGDVRCHREPRDNPLLAVDAAVRASRTAMNARLRELLGGFANPCRFPVVLEWRDGALRSPS